MLNNLFSFLSPENRAICEITWKNIVEPHRSQVTIWRMRIACWVSKATDTHTLEICNKDIILFHGNDGDANASHCYVYTYISLFFFVNLSTCDRAVVIRPA